MLIFIFQTIWLFIDDLAGKSLDMAIIGKFIFYLIPNLMERVLPLTVLLSSILTFGTFAENYEFAAMKASGISLQRSMLSLIIFVIFLGGLTFFFANSVIPAAEQKIYNLRRNIAKVKPAVAIAEGVFSDFEGTGEGTNIKVSRKYGENDRFLEDVIIHKKNKSHVNTTVIKAKTGELVSSEDSEILQLILKDGHYYEEVKSQGKNKKNNNKYPFAKSTFEVYTINIDLSNFNNVDLEEERNVSTDKMKNIARLSKDIDSIRKDNIKIVTAFSKNISNRMGAFTSVYKNDSLKQLDIEKRQLILDSIKKTEPLAVNKKEALAEHPNILSLFKKWKKDQVISQALNSTKNIITSIKGKKEDIDRRQKIYRLHIIALHKKYALALSCVILFFVGAPLGAIIRKGGLGLPMVISILLFLTYYFIGVFAGNNAKEGAIHPILGAWLSTLIMLPLSILLTKRATADRGLSSFGSVFNAIKKLFKKKEEKEAI